MGRAAISGEMEPAGHGGPPAGLEGGDRYEHCRLDDEHEPSDFRSTAEIRTYPFAGKFVKETLSFLVINPRSIAYVGKCVFAFWKRIFFRFIQKYVFRYLQFCH
jgi:hypothetical protein